MPASFIFLFAVDYLLFVLLFVSVYSYVFELVDYVFCFDYWFFLFLLYSYIFLVNYLWKDIVVILF